MEDASLVEASLKRLELGASLGSGELLSIGRLLDCAGQINPTVAMRQSMSFLTVWIFIFNVLSL